jgi:hypothetical protein
MVVVVDLLRVLVVLLVVVQEEVVMETRDHLEVLLVVMEMAEVVLLEVHLVETTDQVDQDQEV